MTSQDVQILTTLLNNHFQRMDAQFSQMRADNAEFKADILQAMNNFTENMNKKFDDFTEKNERKFDDFTEKNERKFDDFTKEIRGEFGEFKKEIRGEFGELKKEVKSEIGAVNVRLDRVEKTTTAIQNDVTGLTHDVQNLYTWDYWTLAIIIGVFVLPVFGENLRKIFTAIYDGIKLLRSAFKK